MMEFNFCLSDEDADRLYACKQLEGADHLSCNNYAKKLLESALWRRFPARPIFDDDGKLLNPERFWGSES